MQHRWRGSRLPSCERSSAALSVRCGGCTRTMRCRSAWKIVGSRLTHAILQGGVDAQQATIVALRAENQAFARRGGTAETLAAPSTSRPSGMEQAAQPGATDKGAKRSKPPRGVKRDRDAITAERVCRAAVPAGSRFKGYEDIGVARPAAFGRGDPLSARALAAAVGRDGAG